MGVPHGIFNKSDQAGKRAVLGVTEPKRLYELFRPSTT